MSDPERMEIVTPRLLLRDFTEAERPAFLAYQADRARAERLFQTFRDWTAEQPRRNYQLAIVQRREPQALVGCCGLRTAGCAPGRAELGIELAPAYRGRHGYALEVGKALLEFGFGQLQLGEIVGVSTTANTRAARLAEWFGAEPIARGPGEVEWHLTREP